MLAPSRSRSERRSKPRQVVRGLMRPYRPPSVMLRGQPMDRRTSNQMTHQKHEPQLPILDWEIFFFEGGWGERDRKRKRAGGRGKQLLSYEQPSKSTTELVSSCGRSSSLREAGRCSNCPMIDDLHVHVRMRHWLLSRMRK